MVESKRTENLTDKFFIYFQILSFYFLPFTLYCLVASQKKKVPTERDFLVYGE
jgi:hypothetical protein